MNQELPPFSCTHSPNLPGLLHELNCTLAITTYQAGKVILISARDEQRLIQLPRTFQKPMGLAQDGNKLAIATQTEVVVLSNAPAMAANYPSQRNTYDALFLPRSSFYTGEIDIHDIHWVGDTLWAVNTRFSCLATLDSNFSFRPQWKPFFIKDLMPEDQCHLNGVAFQNNIPKYVTAIGQYSTPGGWRATKATGGILMDVARNKIIAEGLQMPHSPRIFNNQLYVLESASGDLSRIDVSSGKKELIASLNGFVRGMDKINDFLFIGLSHLRKSSKAFNDLPIASKSLFSGVAVLQLSTGNIVGYIKYENSVEEIYDVRILTGMKRPNLLNHTKVENRLALTTPAGGYWPVLKDDVKNDKNRSDTNTEIGD
jgi:uncharacterized protein (TIGR03032 family)